MNLRFVVAGLTTLLVATGSTAIPLAAVNPPDSASTDVWYVTASRLNLRSGPSTSHSIVAELVRGTALVALAQAREPEQGVWFQVRTIDDPPLRKGWVAAAYLSPARQFAPKGYDHLNYEPIPKPSYPANPRRAVRGVYVSLNTLGSERFDEILSLARSGSINALVVDFKDDIGELLMPGTTAERLNPEAVRRSRSRDREALMNRLKAANLYLIARVVTFKDPLYARNHPDSAILDPSTGHPFKSGDGLMWSSPYDRGFRAYNLGIAEEAAAAGFHEVQFDYIRFPDVPRGRKLDFRTLSTATKAEVVQTFVLEARQRLAPRQVYVAADVFGLVCTTVDDMRIGQYWEAVSNASDFICPMMYPSHYASGVYGLKVPDQHPYELIHRGLQDALTRNRNLVTPAEIRPWIQGFTATWVPGYRNYGPAEIRAQIRALEESGIRSWMLWHPGGRYDPAVWR